MKKRILSALLAAVLLLPVLPVRAAVVEPVTSANLGNKTVNTAYFTSAYVRNSTNGAGIKQPQKAELVIKVKGAVASQSLMALVMPNEIYQSAIEAKGGPAGINLAEGNMETILGATTGASGAQLKVPADFAATEAVLPIQKQDLSEQDMLKMEEPTKFDGSQSYFKKYTYVVFDGSAKSGNGSYYVDNFYLDADGYVYTPSYMVYYNANKPSTAVAANNPTNMPGRQIVRADTVEGTPGNLTLSAQKPTCKGYTFQGWSTSSGDDNASNKTATFTEPGAAGHGKIHQVYAIWSRVEVKHADADKSGFTGAAAQVGKEYADQTHTLKVAATETTKNYKASDAVYVGADGSETPVEPEKLAVNGLPAGLQFTKDNTTWRITGKPLYDSARPIRFTVTVTDASNTSTDTMDYTIPKIEKGERIAPELDWNTALQGRTVSVEAGSETGELIGFYSPNAGAPEYPTEEYIYEYVPKSVYEAKLAELGITDGAAPSDEQRVALDKLWHMVTLDEITEEPAWGEGEPFGTVQQAKPNDWVKGEELGNALEITGLKPNAFYLVRFRETETYTASQYKVVSTSGAVASGGTAASGTSVVFNLMGGKVAVLPVGEDETAPELTDAIKNTYQTIGGLKAGDEVTIPKLPEGFALMKDGQTSVTFHDGTKTWHAGDKFTMPEYSISLAAVWSAKASPDDFRSVTLLDWDDTVLGTAVINKAASGSEVKTAVDAVAETFYAGSYKDVEAFPEDLSKETYVDDQPVKLLTYKKGYNFAGWADVTSETMTETFTAYSELSQFRGEGEDDDETEMLDSGTGPPADGWKNSYLKAAYVENAFCNFTSAGRQDALYVVSDVTLGRYGAAAATTGNYVLKATVKRENKDGFGVTRLKEPVLKATYTASGGAKIYLSVTVNGVNELQGEIIAPKQMNSVEFVLIDMYGATNWVGAASKTDITDNWTGTGEKKAVYDNYTTQRGDPVDNGFVSQGTVAFINEQAKLFVEGDSTNTWNVDVNAVTLTDAGLKRNASGAAITTSGQATTVRNALMAKYREQDGRALTKSEMQSAINGD